MAAEDIKVTEEILEDAAEDTAEELAGGSTEQEETEQADCAEQEGDAEDSKEKKKLFGKKKDKKDKQIEDLNAQVADLTDKVKRSIAEFDNYRKRTDKEKASMFDMGAKSIVEKILPVIDNFERGLAAVPEDKKSEAFVDGMNMVYRQMLKSLNEAGLEQIEAVGKEFDPNLHNAVMHTEDDSLGENVVANEFQKGYTYKGSVVRYSMVQVAN